MSGFVEKKVGEYQRRGGVGRFDRLSAARPRLFAIIVALSLTSLAGAGIVRGILQGSDGWFPIIGGSMLILGGLVLYLIWHRIAATTAEAIREYEQRESTGSATPDG